VHTHSFQKSFYVSACEFPKKIGSHFPFKRRVGFLVNIFLLNFFFQSISFRPKKIRNGLQPRHSWYPRLHFIERNKGRAIKIHKTSIFGVSDKLSQNTYDNMLEAVKLLTMRKHITENKYQVQFYHNGNNNDN